MCIRDRAWSRVESDGTTTEGHGRWVDMEAGVLRALEDGISETQAESIRLRMFWRIEILDEQAMTIRQHTMAANDYGYLPRRSLTS